MARSLFLIALNLQCFLVDKLLNLLQYSICLHWPCLDDLPMPLLDIATAQPSRQRNLYTFRSQAILQSKFVSRNDCFLWKPFVIPEKASNFTLGGFHVRRCGLIIKAVATLEPTRLTQRKKDFGLRVDMDPIDTSVPGAEELSLDEDSAEPNDQEKLRRLRISKANKGNTPWNKGRRHRVQKPYSGFESELDWQCRILR